MQGTKRNKWNKKGPAGRRTPPGDPRRQRREAREAQRLGREQNSKKHKRKRRGNNTLLYGMVLLIMLTIGLVLIFTVFFKVVEIRVEGLSRYPEDEVILASGIEPEVNMFRLDRRAIEERLVRGYSYFEAVRVKLALPDGVVIQVTEAQPAAAVQQGDSYLLLSRAGRVLEKGVADPLPGLTRVKGFGALSIEQGDTVENMLANLRKNAKEAAKYKDEDTLEQRQAKKEQLALVEALAAQMEEQYNMMTAFLDAAQAAGLAGVRSVDLGDKYNIVANYDDRVSIEFGSEAEIAYKIEFVQRLLTEELEDGFEGEIDVSYAGKARVRRVALETQDMTADEYAEYLYSQNQAASAQGGPDAGTEGAGGGQSGAEGGSQSGSEDESESGGGETPAEEEPAEGGDNRDEPENA